MNNGNIYAATRETVEQIKALSRWDSAAVAEVMAVNARIPSATSGRDSGGTIAVIPIAGFIEQRPSFFGAMFGGTSIASLTASFRSAMNDPQVKGIVFDVSSGGGSVFGVTELANEIRAARGVKPIVSVVNSIAASAAYWLASAADEVVSTPSGIAGSIGVYALHVDYSKANEQAGVKEEIISAGEHKADAVDGAPLSDAGRASMQAMVDHIYSTFIADVAAGRGVSKETVLSDYGKGLTFTAPAARSAGLVDRVATMDETLKRLSTPQGRAAVMRAEYVEPVTDDGEAERRMRRVRLTV